MVLGLLRNLFLTVWEILRTYQRAGDKSIAFLQVILETFQWFFPVMKLKNQVVFSVTSFVFHIAVIVVPVFLAGHVDLWHRGTGLSWPTVSNQTADILTIIAVVTGLALVIQRAAASSTRALSRFQDYALPLLIILPFASGFLMMHPLWSPVSYEGLFLVHMMSANLIFILVPITKLSHISIFPLTRIVSELAWHWPSDAGNKVGKSLGKESVPI
jgi:nitrate reductase gamma subunit